MGNATNFQTFVQRLCTPFLSEKNCDQCELLLSWLVSELLKNRYLTSQYCRSINVSQSYVRQFHSCAFMPVYHSLMVWKPTFERTQCLWFHLHTVIHEFIIADHLYIAITTTQMQSRADQKEIIYATEEKLKSLFCSHGWRSLNNTIACFMIGVEMHKNLNYLWLCLTK